MFEFWVGRGVIILVGWKSLLENVVDYRESENMTWW